LSFKEIKNRYLILAVIAIWATLALIFKGVATLELATYQNTWATSAAGDAANSIRGNRTKSTIFIYFFNPIRVFINGFVEIIRMLIATPAPNSIIPILGWLGVIGVVAFLVFIWLWCFGNVDLHNGHNCHDVSFSYSFFINRYSAWDLGWFVRSCIKNIAAVS
jgi:glycine betaine/proline transport system permease protein